MTDSRPALSLDKVILRLPDGMRDRLNELARVNGRSANAEAVQALQAWLLPDHQIESAFVRLIDEMWHKVRRAARRNKRGVVEEILHRLASTFQDEPAGGSTSESLDLRAEIRSAMHEAVEGLLANPERLKRLGYTPSKRGGEPVSE